VEFVKIDKQANVLKVFFGFLRSSTKHKVSANRGYCLRSFEICPSWRLGTTVARNWHRELSLSDDKND
jgi:hypothetical protein